MTDALVALAWLLLIGVLALFLLGWKQSIRIRRDLLVVGERRPEPGVWARAAGDETITLEAANPRQDIGHPGVLGLCWEGGYGQVGEVTAVERLQVIREFRVLEGRPPPLCKTNDPTVCPEVRLDPWAYPSDPGDAGLEFEETSYLSPLGPMGAWLVPAPASGRWAVHVHGWTATRRETVRLLPAVHDTGLTSLVIDYRNDPNAPADPSGHYRFGLEEWADVEAAVDHALGQGASEVVLVGYSTGAAHIMSFLERSELSHAVCGLVLDSPNLILAEAVRHSASGGPRASRPLGQLVLELGMWIADHRWGVDWETTNYVGRADGVLTRPTLVFHGTSDHQVPISVSRQLEARADGVTLVEIPAAGHVMSWNADPARYERHLKGFLRGL